MSKFILNKQSIFSQFKLHETDTGSPMIQVALLTERIRYLTDHLKINNTDYSARRSLLIIVAKRKKFLSYIKKNFESHYKSLIEALKIRDK